MAMLRRALWLSLVLLALTGLAREVVLGVLPLMVIGAPNAGRRVDPARDADQASLRRLGVTRALRVAVGPPAASLSVWVVDPPVASAPPRATVLVLHGIGDRKRSMLGVGRALARLGMRAVLVDNRGHGRSSGAVLSYGVFEARDLSQLVDTLARRGLLAGRLGVLGFSYGAAVALQLAGRDARVRAAVAVAPFVDLTRVVDAYMRRLVPLVPRAISLADVARALQRAGARGGFDPTLASPLRAMGRGSARLLLIHGTGDVHIPLAHSRQLVAAARPRERAKLVEIPGATHNTIMSLDQVHRRARAFLRTQLGVNAVAPAPVRRR